MIDTIVLRIHNLAKYSLLLERLELKKRGGYTTEIATVDRQNVDKLKSIGLNPTQIIDIAKIQRTGEFLVKTQRGKKMNCSGHYEFSFLTDWSKDYVEINFSIPKYKYGSNILQFVVHNEDYKFFKYGDSKRLDYNMEKTPKRLLLFLKNLFDKEFPLDKIDTTDIEINRIDVCYNQIFKSKDDALRYLDYQKMLKKKYSRAEKGGIDYGTTLMFVTDDYSAKIYWKGGEYRKHDLKEHQRINKEKGHQYFRTDHYQDFADRILRYELTIRSNYLNYLFKHNLFRTGCRKFQSDYKCYNKVRNLISQNDRIAKNAGKLEGYKKDLFLTSHPYKKVNQDDKRVYKYVSKIIEQKSLFMFQISDSAEHYNEQSVGYQCNTALFSENLIRICLNKLLAFIQEFQISELPDKEKIRRLIDEKNSIGKRLPKAEMLNFYDLLQEHSSWKKAAQYSRYSRATLARYKSRFKEIGISETCIKPMETYLLPQAKIDFDTYHYILIYQNSLLRGIKIT